APTPADTAPAPLRLVRAARPTPRRAAAHRAACRDDREATLLAAPRDADAAHCCLHGSAPGPSPVAAIRLVRERAPRWLHSKLLARQTARWLKSRAGVNRQCMLALAVPPPHLESQNYLVLNVRPVTHPGRHWR